MFFRRKLQNRRLGRDYVLDVKLRSSQLRAVRVRRLTIGGAILLTLSLAVFFVWAGTHWALDHFLFSNPAFAIRQIDIATDGVLASEQLRTWAGVKPGDNLLALDMARVKRNLKSIPFIEMVSIERILPHTLRVRVTEREPVAQIEVMRSRSGGGTEVMILDIDAEGALTPPLDPRFRAQPTSQPPEQLPLITNGKVLDARPGQTLQTPQIKAALELILAFERSSMARFVDIKKIDAGSSGVLTASISDGSEITFGTADFEQQLRRWYEIQQTGQRVSKAVWALDLAVSNNIPARWLEASLVPTPTPKIPKPARTKKKHV